MISTLAALAIAALALTGCAAAAPDVETPVATQADSVTVTEAWVKATESGMTGAFGMIENTGDTEVTVVAASTAASTMVQLHETTDDGTGTMSMREKDGGFPIAAGETFELAPGGNHIMFMDVTEPIMAGDEITIVLEFADGSTLEFTAPAKDFTGANENYDDSTMEMNE
jgi:hypothetical protein